jgi:DNA-binding response OmpR family regulator
MEILMVEDSFMYARITMGALREGRVEVEHRLTWLRDGVEALEFLRRRRKFVHAPRPDLVLLDLGLPKVDGRQVLSEMRLDKDLYNMPVVVMTSSTDERDRIACERLNVQSNLIKPVDLSSFLSVIRDLRGVLRDDLLMPAV